MKTFHMPFTQNDNFLLVSWYSWHFCEVSISYPIGQIRTLSLREDSD